MIKVIYYVILHALGKVTLSKVVELLTTYSKELAKRKLGDLGFVYSTTENVILLPVEKCPQGLFFIDAKKCKFLLTDKEVTLLNKLRNYKDEYGVLWEISLLPNNEVLAKNEIGDIITGLEQVQELLTPSMSSKI